MPAPIVVRKTLAASSANNIALSQTPVSGTALTLNGSTVSGGVATLDTQRRVLLTFGNEAANRTAVVTGTNQAGVTITETLAVASGATGTIATLQDFFTVTKILPLGGGWTAAVTVGTNGVGSTPWFVPDRWLTPTNIEVGVKLISGAATYSIEITDDDPMPNFATMAINSYALPFPFAYGAPGLTSLGSNSSGAIAAPPGGMRLTVLSGQGVVQATFRQAGYV